MYSCTHAPTCMSCITPTPMAGIVNLSLAHCRTSTVTYGWLPSSGSQWPTRRACQATPYLACGRRSRSRTCAAATRPCWYTYNDVSNMICISPQLRPSDSWCGLAYMRACPISRINGVQHRWYPTFDGSHWLSAAARRQRGAGSQPAQRIDGFGPPAVARAPGLPAANALCITANSQR